ncbi:uncharacterized protein ACOB8E_002564 [Sarcophilus harrisii]
MDLLHVQIQSLAHPVFNSAFTNIFVTLDKTRAGWDWATPIEFGQNLNSKMPKHTNCRQLTPVTLEGLAKSILSRDPEFKTPGLTGSFPETPPEFMTQGTHRGLTSGLLHNKLLD